MSDQSSAPHAPPFGRESSRDEAASGDRDEPGNRDEPGSRVEAGNRVEPGSQVEAGSPDEPGNRVAAGDRDEPGDRGAARDRVEAGDRVEVGNRNEVAGGERGEVDGAEMAARVLAFFLPQFHPMPDNDEWWGPGFTEWTNVAGGRRLYPGHYQPHIPGELGFYDLRLDETREQQAALARDHGVSGFCFWHYWFAGRRVLDEVVDRVHQSGVPDFPFCLAWANESWSDKRSIGGQDRLLIEQTYPGEDDYRRHFDAIVPLLHDPRYVRIDGRPVFVVYRPMLLPDPARFAELWRELAVEAGLPGLFLIGQSYIDGRPWAARASGFDAVAPWYFPPRAHRWRVDHKYTTPDILATELTRRTTLVPSVFWQRHWNRYIPWVSDDGELCFPSVLPNWDNTPRMGRDGVVMHGASPELFGQQVRRALELVADRPADHRLFFVRSWNEWAEGNHLEPDRRYGRGYLEALRDELERARPRSR